MKTTTKISKIRLGLSLNQIANFVNFCAALAVAILFFLPLRNFTIGIDHTAAAANNLTALALAPDSDQAFPLAPPFYLKNMSDSCVALWIQECLVPLEYLCHKTAVDANSSKFPDDDGDRQLEMEMGAGCWTDRQDFLASFCPETNIYFPRDHPLLNYKRCLMQWDVDRILPKPIYSPNVGESYWLCEPSWMHGLKGYIYL